MTRVEEVGERLASALSQASPRPLVYTVLAEGDAAEADRAADDNAEAQEGSTSKPQPEQARAESLCWRGLEGQKTIS